jgi:hypothetical protein
VRCFELRATSKTQSIGLKRNNTIASLGDENVKRLWVLKPTQLRTSLHKSRVCKVIIGIAQSLRTKPARCSIVIVVLSWLK